jgi:hypothetical protein
LQGVHIVCCLRLYRIVCKVDNVNACESFAGVMNCNAERNSTLVSCFVGSQAATVHRHCEVGGRSSFA